jgi:hypothetical protein
MATKQRRKRSEYSDDKKQLVRNHYQHCLTRDEKIELARRIGIEHPEDNLHKLYNLASREKATRSHINYNVDEYAELLRAGTVPIVEKVAPKPAKYLQTRQDPTTTHFSRKDDEYIKRHFGTMSIADIAVHRGHTESAIMYRARHLRNPETNKPIRRPCVGYYLDKVYLWLNLKGDEASFLKKNNVEIRPLPDEAGKAEQYWVHTVSLAKFLREFGPAMVVKRRADRFFIMDVLESAQDIETGKVISEDCYFLEHGHVCVNRLAGASCGLYCDGNDPKCSVKDLRP